ncbi:hypothetical protein ACLKMY_39500, partial [Paraburkholderia mimosarum]
MESEESESVGDWLKKCGDVHVDRVVGRLLGQLQKMQIGPLEAISRSVDAVSAALESYPENVRPALLEMSRNGWYLDPAMPMSLPRRFKLAMEAGDAAQAEQSMVDHFERRTGGILSELVGRHPARGQIFRAAFAAHSLAGCGNT